MPTDPAAAKALFLEALAIKDAGTRARMIEQRAGGDLELLARVKALLAANDRAMDAAEEVPAGNAGKMQWVGPTAAYAENEEPADTVIGGKYSLVEIIGEGGMGSVWRAKQTEPVKRFVAVKLIKAGMDSKSVLATHRSTISTMANLGLAYRRVGRKQEAAELVEKARDALLAKLGPEHLDTLRISNSLATIYDESGRYGDAIRVLDQVYDVRGRTLGPDDPDTLLTLGHLAHALFMAKRFDRSVPLYEEQLKRNDAHFGRTHPNSLLTFENLVSNYRASGQIVKAVPILEEARRSPRASPPPSWVGDWLLEAYVAAKRTAEVKTLVKEILAAARQNLSADSPKLAGMLYVYSGQLISVGAVPDGHLLSDDHANESDESGLSDLPLERLNRGMRYRKHFIHAAEKKPDRFDVDRGERSSNGPSCLFRHPQLQFDPRPR